MKIKVMQKLTAFAKQTSLTFAKQTGLPFAKYEITLQLTNKGTIK